MLGPGDDAALVRAPDGRVVVSTDVLIEGRHFRRHWSSGYDVGRKAAAQNLADVVAMGAVPTAIVVGLGIPADLPVTWLDGLTAGFRDECALVGASVAGGDITRCDLVVIGVTVLGDLQGRAAVERSGARAGDVVAVAGCLGRSAAGLALLTASHPNLTSDTVPGSGPSARLNPPSAPGVPPHLDSSAGSDPSACTGEVASKGVGPSPSFAGEAAKGDEPAGTYQDLLKEAVDVHLRPRPPYPCGPEAARLGARAMIDVSDGLLQDLGHVAKASQVRIDLDPEAFAVPGAVRAAAEELGADPLEWVLTGGEDHALAATFPPEVSLPESWRVVGKVSEGEGVHVKGRAFDLGGWDHFR